MNITQNNGLFFIQIEKFEAAFKKERERLDENKS